MQLTTEMMKLKTQVEWTRHRQQTQTKRATKDIDGVDN